MHLGKMTAYTAKTYSQEMSIRSELSALRMIELNSPNSKDMVKTAADISLILLGYQTGRIEGERIASDPILSAYLKPLESAFRYEGMPRRYIKGCDDS